MTGDMIKYVSQSKNRFKLRFVKQMSITLHLKIRDMLIFFKSWNEL